MDERMNRHPLNAMCAGCRHLDDLCEGCYSDTYSACIWKAASKAEFSNFLQQAGAGQQERKRES